MVPFLPACCEQIWIAELQGVVYARVFVTFYKINTGLQLIFNLEKKIAGRKVKVISYN